MDTQIKKLTELEELDALYKGSAYTITGTGGDLQEWVVGVQKLLNEKSCGTVQQWFTFTGALVNAYVGENIYPDDQFDPDLIFLAFSLDGMDIGKLAMFKLIRRDRWFDDIIDNINGY